MCGYFCIRFIDFRINGNWIEYTNLFSPNDYEKKEIFSITQY